MNIAYALPVIALLVIVYIYYNMEGFIASEDYYPKNILHTSENPTILSNGNVQKILLKDGEYLYDFFYNVPNAFSQFHVIQPGVSFNQKTEKGEYQVSMGATKDDLKKVGVLERRGDGYHVFRLKTKEDYKISCILLNDKVIHCLDL